MNESKCVGYVVKVNIDVHEPVTNVRLRKAKNNDFFLKAIHEKTCLWHKNNLYVMCIMA